MRSGAGVASGLAAGRRFRAHPDAELTPEQVQVLGEALVAKRRELLQEQGEHMDIGRFDIERSPEPEEAAALDATQSTMIDLAEAERALLLKIERALQKLDAGTYGVSEESGEPIGFPRLAAIPWAVVSAADQEEREQRIRRGERQ